MRNRIDQSIRAYGAFLLKNRWLVFLGLTLLTVFMVSNLRKVTMDASNEGFFAADDPVLIQYTSFREQFGRDDMILLLLKPDQIFSVQFFETLQALHEEMEGADPLVKEVNSLYNARKTMGVEGGLEVKDLMEDFEGSKEEIAELKSYVLNHPLYKNLLISEDGVYTTLVIETSAFSDQGAGDTQDFSDISLDAPAEIKRTPLQDTENTRVVLAIREIVDRYSSDQLEIRLAGSPVVTTYLKASMMKDMRKLTLMAIGMIAIFLFILFRRTSGVVMPLLTVIFSLLYTIGLMGLLGVPLKLPTQILPSFLIAVGIGASVHMMALFYKDFVIEHGNKEAAILDAMEHSGLPIMMTSLTTAAGFLSFGSAEVAPIADLGLFAAFGVMVALFMTLTMIPVALSIFPVRSIKDADPEGQPHFVETILIWIGDFSYGHAGKIVAVTAVLFLISFAGISKLKFTHNIMEWFPESSENYQNTTLMDKEMKGSISLEFVLDTGEENGLYDPEIQRGLEHMGEFAMSLPGNNGVAQPIGKATGLNTMLKEINQALNENDPAHYTIPDDRKMIAQEFLLFENSGSDDLEKNVDSLFSMTRLTLKSFWQDASGYEHILIAIREEAEKTFAGKGTFYITGMIALMSETVYLMINTMVVSYLAAGVVITILMILLIGKIRLGLLSMIPNLLPIIFTLGLMGWLGINLDMFTLLIGSIVIGLAVDDTIHFFHNYRKYYDEFGDVKLAIEHTLDTAGRAMLVTTIVLTLGFWLYMLATMNNLFNFGLLVGVAIILAFLADVVLAPALLTLYDRKKKK